MVTGGDRIRSRRNGTVVFPEMPGPLLRRYHRVHLPAVEHAEERRVAPSRPPAKTIVLMIDYTAIDQNQLLSPNLMYKIGNTTWRFYD